MDSSKPQNNSEDDNLIIANQPTVSDFGGSDVHIVEDYKNKKPTLFTSPVSTDSSWESSSDCSSEGNDDDDATVEQPHVKFGACSSKKPANKITGASASNLSKSTRRKDASSRCEDKAVSLPVLETGGTVSPSAPSVAYESGKNSKSDPEKIMTVKESDIENIEILSGGEFSDLEAATSDKVNTLAAPGSIVRHGAIRMSMGSTRFSGLRSRRQRTNSGSPATSLLNQENDGGSSSIEPKHLATTHEDTSTGAVHCFKDEFGQWYSYTFGDDSSQPIAQPFLAESLLPSASRRRLVSLFSGRGIKKVNKYQKRSILFLIKFILKLRLHFRVLISPQWVLESTFLRF